MEADSLLGLCLLLAIFICSKCICCYLIEKMEEFYFANDWEKK